VNLAQAALALGHTDHAVSFLEQAASISEELGYERFAGTRAAVALEIAWSTGAWSDLDERAQRMAGDPDSVACVQWPAELVRGRLAMADGRATDAREMFEAARDVARSAGSVRGMASAAAALSGMHLEAGDEGLALESAHAAVDAIRNKGVWMWGGDVFPEAVRVLLRTGRPDEAGELVRAFAGGIRGADAPAAEAALAECRGELARSEGRHDLALRSLSRARSTWSRLGNPYREALAEERRGLVMTEAGKREEGAARLRRSADTLRALGATRDAARVRAALRELGVVIPSPGRRGRRGYGDALSPRELEVARSAARGWTNRRIAEELFLSPKTVEHHLAAAMRKLRVSSRTALVGAIAGGDGEPIH
jgi:DNA-binding CsgD family transcriptional regulator/tetratricopeptide (TPR) repeat protein